MVEVHQTLEPQRLAPRPRRFLIAALLASMAVNAYACVHYRIPHVLWEWVDKKRDVRPRVTVSTTHIPASRQPSLTASRLAADPQAIADWQSSAREKLLELLGCQLSTQVPTVRSVSSETVEGVQRELLILHMPDDSEIPAFLLRPSFSGKRPGLLVIPGHSWGIVATAGIIRDYQNANALELAKAGYVVLTIEVRGFGYVRALGAEPAMDHNAFTGYCLAQGTTRLGVTVADAYAAVSYLASRPDVDSTRLAAVGFSSGGKAAIYLAGLDSRITATIASGCVMSNEDNFRVGLHDPYEAIPGIAAWLSMGDCLAMIAPRPLLVHWGREDNVRDERCASYCPSSVAECDSARLTYRQLDREQAMEEAVTPGYRHEFDNAAARRFLQKHLSINPT